MYVQAWGGTNTIAQALWDLKYNRGYTHEESQALANKMIIYAITTQDPVPNGNQVDGPDIRKEFIWKEFPDLEYLHTPFSFVAYRPHTAGLVEYVWTPDFLANEIRNKGVDLADRYKSFSGARIEEGDSLAFLYNMDSGLRGMENPEYGSWGGRFYHSNRNGTGFGGSLNFWLESEDLEYVNKPVWGPLSKWWNQVQWDLAARVGWAYKSYAQANHPPVPVVNGSKDVYAVPGQTVFLDASGSYDPDGDPLMYTWSQYYTKSNPRSRWWTNDDTVNDGSVLAFHNANSQSGAYFTIPENAEPGKILNILLDVWDGDIGIRADGNPSLGRSQQIIVHIQDGDTPVNQAPVASAGEDQIVADTDEANGETVQLDGSGSFDPDDGSIAHYSWQNASGVELGIGVIPPFLCPMVYTN